MRTTKRFLPVLGIALTLGLIAGACGSDDDDSASSSASSSAAVSYTHLRAHET